MEFTIEDIVQDEVLRSMVECGNIKEVNTLVRLSKRTMEKRAVLYPYTVINVTRLSFDDIIKNGLQKFMHITRVGDLNVLKAFNRLTTIKFCKFSNFNQTIDSLPDTLTHLTLGDSFNQPVDKLPTTLTHLTLGYWFNQPVDNLPETLNHLTL